MPYSDCVSPKSRCTSCPAAWAPTSAAESAAGGAELMSVFHGLSGGRTGQPPTTGPLVTTKGALVEHERPRQARRRWRPSAMRLRRLTRVVALRAVARRRPSIDSVCGPRQRRVPIAFGTDGADYGDESDHGPFPIPPTAPIEGAPAGQPNPTEGDRHIIVIQRERCVDYELYNAVRQSGGASWQVSSSARWDLTRNGRRPAGWTSADAAGLPIFPGLLRYDEAASGTIRHALRFTLPRARRAWQAPASHCGTATDPSTPPYGSRWRLKASFDETPYSGPALAIVRALKRYGLMFADQGSSMFITGTTDRRWTTTIEDINQRHPIPGDAFEVVAGPTPTPC